MLALTRRQGERIFIGDNITIKIVTIHGDKVRIAIDAPKDLAVDREETRLAKIKSGDYTPNHQAA